MSMPTFPDPSTIMTRDEAINAILTSIALEETALSHIMNAEGEKIQFALKQAQEKHGVDLHMVLKANKSVSNLLEQVKDIQIILKSKLRIALEFLPDTPLPPPPPPPPPPTPCTTEFLAVSGCWTQGRTLHIKANSDCENGIELYRNNCDWMIKLPPIKTFEISVDLELTSADTCPITVKMALLGTNETIHTKEYYTTDSKHAFHIKDKQVWKTRNHDNFLEIRLMLPYAVCVKRGKIRIKEFCNP